MTPSHPQRGATLVELTISTALFGMLTVGYMTYDKTTQQDTHIDSTVEELNQLSAAAGDYAARAAKLISASCNDTTTKTATDGMGVVFVTDTNCTMAVANPTAPTITELITLGALPPEFPLKNRLNNGDYQVRVKPRSDCGMSAGAQTNQCDMDILVYINEPLMQRGQVDQITAGRLLRILGDKAGFAEAATPAQITGFESRWAYPNPDAAIPKRAGILMLKSGYHTQLAAVAMRNDALTSVSGELKRVTLNTPYYVISGLESKAANVDVTTTGLSSTNKTFAHDSEFKTAVVITGTGGPSIITNIIRSGAGDLKANGTVNIEGAGAGLTATTQFTANAQSLDPATQHAGNTAQVTLHQNNPTRAQFTTNGTTNWQVTTAMIGDGFNMNYNCDNVAGVQPQSASGYDGNNIRVTWLEQRTSNNAGDFCVQWRKQISNEPYTVFQDDITKPKYAFNPDTGQKDIPDGYEQKAVGVIGSPVEVGRACDKAGKNCRVTP